jgi:hypothetical protein
VIIFGLTGKHAAACQFGLREHTSFLSQRWVPLVKKRFFIEMLIMTFKNYLKWSSADDSIFLRINGLKRADKMDKNREFNMTKDITEIFVD